MPQPLSQVTRRQQDPLPHELAASWANRRDLVFFDSAADAAGVPQISVVAAEPSCVVEGCSEADWQHLAKRVSERQIACEPDRPYPTGFAAGFVEYDGRFRFGFYDSPAVFDHCAHAWQTPQAPASRVPPRGGVRTAFSAGMDEPRFCAMVRRAQEYIAAGDIYQVNLSHRFRGPWSGDAFAFYEALRHYSPAPYAAFLDFGDRQVLSTSPESFLRISGRQIRTRPIKGTRPRKADPVADERSAYDLVTSQKEIAELVMITDLERNDLGQICEFGSVRASELLKVERFEQVFHMVSTVEGTLRPEVDPVTALRKCFPGGSITGAPKRRAMEIIAELEPEARGLYTGAIGWFGFNGESQFNIAIRTVVIDGDEAHFHVGAGIVADSQPALEWEETLHKAAGILLAAERAG